MVHDTIACIDAMIGYERITSPMRLWSYMTWTFKNNLENRCQEHTIHATLLPEVLKIIRHNSPNKLAQNPRDTQRCNMLSEVLRNINTQRQTSWHRTPIIHSDAINGTHRCNELSRTNHRNDVCFYKQIFSYQCFTTLAIAQRCQTNYL